MQEIIQVINKLQDILNSVGENFTLSLPQIVVVGSQSSGKSSVLEGIVGRDFLPRGTGIVTRAPLILHLVHTPLGDYRRQSLDCDWATFDHKPNTIFTNFDEVRGEIERRTNELTGNTKNISRIPIILKVFSATVVDLSLVDLPGIVRIPVDGQPEDIEYQVRAMIHEYISNPNSIILAVTPANQDLATSDALQMAKDVDEEGERTLAVLTKLDLMDRGTNARDMLLGKSIPVKLGIIGVINRSQEDIVKKKPMEECLNDEARYLLQHYRELAVRNGIPYLAKTLSQLLKQHIKKCLPNLKAELDSKLAQYKSEVQAYGEPLLDKNTTCLRILKDYEDTFKQAIDCNVRTDKIFGGARIRQIFTNVFDFSLNRIDPLQGLTVQQILTAIHNSTGTYSPVVISEVGFMELIKHQIKLLEKPCLECINLVYQELGKITKESFNQMKNKHLRFTMLVDHIEKLTNNLIDECLTPAEIFVKELVENELSYIDTDYPDFRTKELMNFIVNPEGEPKVDMKSDAKSLSNESMNGSSENLLTPQSSMPAPQQVQQAPQKELPRPPPDRNVFPFSLGSYFKRPKLDLPPVPQQKSSFVSYPEPETNGIHKMQHSSQQVDYQSQNGTSTSHTSSAQAQMAQLQVYHVPKDLKKLNEKDRRDYLVTERLIREYFTIVRKTLRFMVPKAIMRLLVDKVKASIYNELINTLLLSGNLEEYLKEDPEIVVKREAAQRMLKALEEATKKVANFRI